ncbi:MAG: hypothetical protein QXT63_02890 [Thermoplasmata archaeon]
MKRRKIEIELMNVLYREPMRESRVASAIARTRQISEQRVIGVLKKLQERKLIKNIDKVSNEGSEPIYKLTKEGELLLESEFMEA